MAREFRLPDLGSGLKEGQIVNWLVEVGQSVTTDDTLCEVETEKAVIEIPVPYAGKVLSLSVAAGEVVEVGAVLAQIATEDDADETPAVSGARAPVQAKPAVSSAKASPKPIGDRVRAMPSIRRLAREHGVDLATVDGSGRQGRITRADVLAILDKKPERATAAATSTSSAAKQGSANDSDFEKFTMIRRTISERLSRSWHEIPHVFTRMEIDATRLLIVRKALIEELDTKIPIEAILVKACLPALREFPAFNATVVNDGIQLHKHYNIGVAVDTETGLVVPVLKGADRLSLRETVNNLLDLLPRAVNRKASTDELMGATFTVNNIGALGHLMGTSIIPEGTTAILSVGRAVDKPVAIDGKVEIRPVLEVSLSFDHRAIDGGLAQRFMARIRENLEEPVKALI
jgi:pyruvate dehydrogenase E2 component (dihydrolipoamide acetyltransferase)